MTMNTLARAQRRVVAFNAVMALAWSVPATAQTRLYVLTSGDPGGYECVPASCRPGRLIQLDLDRRLVVADTPVVRARTSGWGPLATPDGRYLLWSGSDGANAWDEWPMVVSLFDLASRWQSTAFEAPETYIPIVVHPSRMRGFSDCRDRARSRWPSQEPVELCRLSPARTTSCRLAAVTAGVYPSAA